MSARTEAFARYLTDIYQQYDALLDSDRLAQAGLSAVEPQPGESMDIEALAFLVLIEATQDAEDDLREIMGEVRAAAQVKGRLRDAIAKLNAERKSIEEREQEEYEQALCDQIDCLDTDLIAQLLIVTAIRQSDRQVLALADEITLIRQRLHRPDSSDDLDSLSELSEMESLRLQMIMDRRSRFIEMLSNLLKKMADTNDTITQNLK